MSELGYNGNSVLLGPKEELTFTQHDMDEYIKCMEDPLYFIENYVKIINVDHGLVPFSMWPFQRHMIKTFHENRFVIGKYCRQSGKSTSVISYLLHQALFNENYVIAVLAHKGSTSRELLSRIKKLYESLPPFLKQAAIRWNQGDLEFGNGSKVLAAATTSASIRGFSINLLYLDEFAFIPKNQADDFFRSVYPTVSSGKTTKILMTSTPNGLNMFYHMWMDAVEGRSTYKAVEAHWSEVPGRDEKWRSETVRNIGIEKFRVEFETEFLGSSNTLISGEHLRRLRYRDPIRITEKGAFRVYEEPVKREPLRGIRDDHTYAIMVDPSRGQNQDYSAFSVIDVSEIPYKQVATFKDNKISPILFPTMVHNAARYYNDAFVLIEISDNGQQVADILHYELEYENIVKIEARGKNGQRISAGYKNKVQFGLKQSTATKRMGCANLKLLIEMNKLVIWDAPTIMELTTFVASKDSFAAEEGNHDDLAMSLVIFGWFANQRFFKEAVSNNIRQVIQKEMMDLEDEDLLDFYIDDHGYEDYNVLEAQTRNWQQIRRANNPFESDYEVGSDDWRELLIGPDEIARQRIIKDKYSGRPLGQSADDEDLQQEQVKDGSMDSRPTEVQSANPWHKESFNALLKQAMTKKA